MSRIAKKPITIPQNVEVKLKNQCIHISGPRGSLTQAFPDTILVKQEKNLLSIKAVNEKETKQRALLGTIYRLITNSIIGVTEGFTKRLTIHGIGYRAHIQDNNLALEVGFSHLVYFPIPADITIQLEGNNTIIISSIDKQRVGEVAAQIRRTKKPEPYKGKGILYEGEVVRKKAGKQATGTK